MNNRNTNGNIAGELHALAATQPNQPAVVELGGKKRSVTFSELSKRIASHAAALTQMGFASGDRVVLLVNQPLDFVTTTFALFHAGLVPVMLDPGMGASRLLACIKAQAPRGLVGIRKAMWLRQVFRPSFASVKLAACVEGGAIGAHDLVEMAKTAPVRPVAAPPEPVSAVLFTSGSTGPPKGVVYTQAMIGAQTKSIGGMFGIQAGERDVACFLPFGLFSVGMGMTAVFPDMDFAKPAKASPQKIADALQGADSAFASPALWTPFAAEALKQQWRFPHLKRVLTAGAPVAPSLQRDLLQCLPSGDVFTPYGATEALPVAFMSGRTNLEQTAARTEEGHGVCVGMPIGVEVRIIVGSDVAVADIANTVTQPAFSVGEVIVRGPCVTKSYDGLPEATARSKIIDGDTIWHRMGDAGYLDDQGRLWFCGRFGQRVSKASGDLFSVPVEAVVGKLAGRRAALVGVGKRGQQQAVVFIEFGNDKPHFTQADADRLKIDGVDAVLPFFGFFPVDRRHNAKIEREQLALLAAKRLNITVDA
jgi:olefin beta-lactone synthetase